jgi:hypothetical protein
MSKSPISPIYYPLLDSAVRSLDIKVKSPWPGQTTRREEFRAFMEPEHVLVRKARENVRCRMICLETKAYEQFFRKSGSRMAKSPFFEEAQQMIANFENAGGQVRRLIEAANPEISFAIADEAKAVLFLGTWPKPGQFEETVLETNDASLVRFLVEAFDICWSAQE